MAQNVQPIPVMLSSVRCESWPIRGGFTISRGSKRTAEVVVAELSATLPDGRTALGRGECVPYARYGETVDGVAAAMKAQTGAIASGLNRLTLRDAIPAGAARNALDCAFWDLEARMTGLPVWQLAGLAGPPAAVATAFTISLDTPEKMGAAALKAVSMPLLKLKLGGGDGDLDRVAAVRRNAPDARLIVDANEGWTLEQLRAIAPGLADLGVLLIEQPLPAAQDAALDGYRSPVPLGADESFHGPDSLAALRGRYSILNLKLDKTGGLTEALVLKKQAEEMGFGLMVGCMVATSLSMAPAFLLAQGAAFADLDGPLLLERDRADGFRYDGAWMNAAEPPLWG